MRVKPSAERFRFADGPYRANASFDGTERRVIGMTPVEKYQLPTSNRLNVKYTYGLLRGARTKARDVDCIYEIEVSKDLYHTKTFDNVILTPGNTTALKAELIEKYKGTVKYPSEKEGAR